MNSFDQTQRVWRWWSKAPPKEILGDREALLQYELSLIHRAFTEESREIIAELVNIEAMKPPRSIYMEASLLTAQQVQAMTSADHERAKRELGHKLKERPR